VNGTLLTGEKDEAVGDVFNIGNNSETSIGELAEIIVKLTGSKSKIVNMPYEDAYGESYEDTRRRVPDINKAKQRLGFEARTRLEEGLNKTIEWAKENYKF
jgi:UDP-glucose 4-epimerase